MRIKSLSAIVILALSSPAFAKYYIYKPVSNLVAQTNAGTTTPTTPTPPAPPPVVKATIASNNGVLSWSSGAIESSCQGYLVNDATHDASGAVNAFYAITVGGVTKAAYCDMTGGGWMQVAYGKSDTAIDTWKNSTGAMTMPGTIDGLSQTTWKFSDAEINSIAKQAYRVVGSGSYNPTRYFKGTCQYKHTVVVSGDCAISYPDAAFTGTPRIGREGKGLSDNTGAGSYFVMVNNHTGYEGYGWCAGSGSIGAGGCGAAGNRTSVSIWVR